MKCLALLSYGRIPFWSYAKLITTCWLVLPYFSGATYVYEHYVRPFYMNPQQTVNIWYVPRKKDIFSKPDDILTAAEKYIEENGPEAFENLISKVCLVTIFYFSFIGTICSPHDEVVEIVICLCSMRMCIVCNAQPYVAPTHNTALQHGNFKIIGGHDMSGYVLKLSVLYYMKHDAAILIKIPYETLKHDACLKTINHSAKKGDFSKFQ